MQNCQQQTVNCARCFVTDCRQKMANRLRQKVQSAFQMHGFSLRSECSNYLIDLLGTVNEVSIDEYIDSIIDQLHKEPLESSVIEKHCIEKIISNLKYSHGENTEAVFEVISAFNVPKYVYNRERKKFDEITNNELSLFGNAKAKTDVYRDRYSLIHQRTLRHELFTPPQPGMSEEQTSNKFKLSPIEYLQSCTTKVKGVIVLGMITELKEGKFYLEDVTGVVLMDLKDTVFHTGLFTEGSYVLAEGCYEDGVFYVSALGFPPVEPAKITRAYFGSLNMFGSTVSYSGSELQRLKQIEVTNRDAMFVIVSDIWLDSVDVMDKLRVLLSGYSQLPPTCFILCGNFTSQPYGVNQFQTLSAGFAELSTMLSHYPRLVSGSRFLIVPGPGDCGSGPPHTLPRAPLPRLISEPFCERVPSAVFTTSPARLQYCTQQVVISRTDTLTKMCRNSVNFPDDLNDLTTLYVKSLISGSHLSPLPTGTSPVYWSHDHALHLYPIPDLLVTAENYDPFTVEQHDCVALNPGSFSQNNYTFKVYFPATRTVENSKI